MKLTIKYHGSIPPVIEADGLTDIIIESVPISEVDDCELLLHHKGIDVWRTETGTGGFSDLWYSLVPGVSMDSSYAFNVDSLESVPDDRTPLYSHLDDHQARIAYALDVGALKRAWRNDKICRHA